MKEKLEPQEKTYVVQHLFFKTELQFGPSPHQIAMSAQKVHVRLDPRGLKYLAINFVISTWLGK